MATLLFVDDYKKWHKSFEQLVRAKWPESKMRVGQDVEHWKQLLLAPLDERHADYPDVVKSLQRVVDRIIGYEMEERYEMEE